LPTPRFYLVLDFEATCERDDRRWPNEIIEFPAQLIDSETLRIVDEFHEFVRPTEKPKLTTFCTELTGIKQRDVETADTLDVVLGRFQQWLCRHAGRDPRAALPVTCGDWDLDRMLPGEARRKHMRYPAQLKGWCNIKQPFEELTGHKGRGMADMLRALHLRLVGRHHSGIDDTRNIGRVLVELVQRFGQHVTWTGGRLPEHAEAPTTASEKLSKQVAAGSQKSRRQRQDSVQAAAVPGDAKDENNGSRCGRLDSKPCTLEAAHPARNAVTSDAAKNVAGSDSTEMAVRRLRKKLQQMELLELRQKEGDALCGDQLQKLARLPEVRSQLAELTAPIPDAWD